LSRLTWTDSLPINRFKTTLFGLPLGIASMSAFIFAISAGGKTRRQLPA